MKNQNQVHNKKLQFKSVIEKGNLKIEKQIKKKLKLLQKDSSISNTWQRASKKRIYQTTPRNSQMFSAGWSNNCVKQIWKRMKMMKMFGVVALMVGRVMLRKKKGRELNCQRWAWTLLLLTKTLTLLKLSWNLCQLKNKWQESKQKKPKQKKQQDSKNYQKKSKNCRKKLKRRKCAKRWARKRLLL